LRLHLQLHQRFKLAPVALADNVQVVMQVNVLHLRLQLLDTFQLPMAPHLRLMQLPLQVVAKAAFITAVQAATVDQVVAALQLVAPVEHQLFQAQTIPETLVAHPMELAVVAVAARVDQVVPGDQVAVEMESRPQSPESQLSMQVVAVVVDQVEHVDGVVMVAVDQVQPVVHINLHSVLTPIRRRQVPQTLAEVEEERHMVALEAVLLVEAA
jgi:hypothetical protein